MGAIVTWGSNLSPVTYVGVGGCGWVGTYLNIQIAINPSNTIIHQMQCSQPCICLFFIVYHINTWINPLHHPINNPPANKQPNQHNTRISHPSSSIPHPRRRELCRHCRLMNLLVYSTAGYNTIRFDIRFGDIYIRIDIRIDIDGRTDDRRTNELTSYDFLLALYLFASIHQSSVISHQFILPIIAKHPSIQPSIRQSSDPPIRLD